MAVSKLPQVLNRSALNRATLPAAAVIQTGRWVWTTMWRLMVDQLAPANPQGNYQRPVSQFRESVGTPAYPPEPGRYRLYVGLSCPWAHRTLVVRSLKGLEAAIPMMIVVPNVKIGGWSLSSPEAGCQTLAQLYALAQPGYTGRCTVPVLWDSQTGTIVNNESADIIVMLNAEFNSMAKHPDFDLYPAALRAEIDQWNERIYVDINNGVYRCGFAQTQAAYEQACTALFQCLDELEQVLAERRFLCGANLTLADVRLFTTLIRFDVAYYGLFKCNLRRIVDYPNLGGYLRDFYQWPGIAETCDLEAVKRDYYGNLFPLNPGGLIPMGPAIEDLSQPSGRGS